MPESDPIGLRHGLLEQPQILADELWGREGRQPVRLPPGRARLATRPLETGSAGPAKTMGMVLVACLAARAACVFAATMTSTLSATSSAARAGNRSSGFKARKPSEGRAIPVVGFKILTSSRSATGCPYKGPPGAESVLKRE